MDPQNSPKTKKHPNLLNKKKGKPFIGLPNDFGKLLPKITLGTTQHLYIAKKSFNYLKLLLQF